MGATVASDRSVDRGTSLGDTEAALFSAGFTDNQKVALTIQPTSNSCAAMRRLGFPFGNFGNWVTMRIWPGI